MRVRLSAFVKALSYAAVATLATAPHAAADDRIYFSATDNVTSVLVQTINNERVRLDISTWYLSEHAISIAIANRFAAGVPVRIIGDRAAPFENDAHTKTELYWLASQGVPIRMRFNPTWYPELDHWKAAIFVGQNIVEFGSGNFAPTELAPVNATNYCDETELFTDDPALVNAFKTKFDVMWNDTTNEPQSLTTAPYLKDWNDACANEFTGNCADYYTLYPNPAPMIINTARLEPDYPMPADLYWGQGSGFNNRLTQEILNENARIDIVVYRLEVDNITQALLSKFQAHVPVRVIIDPGQYTNIRWPEYWLTHANIDKLYAAGVPVVQRVHDGVTHMKTLITSTYASNASSNFGPAWQRDHDYFVPASTKPTIYQAIADRFQTMWNDTVGFAPFQPTPPYAPALATPASGSSAVPTTTSLVWNIAPLAVSYDVYLGTTQSNLALVANVPAEMSLTPPTTYSWTPPAPLQSGTTYYWKVVSRTNATPVNAAMIAASSMWSFTTGGSAGPPAAPANPSPADGTAGVGLTPTLGWSAGTMGTTFNVAFGTANPPPAVATALTSSSYAPGTLTANTTYFWSVTAVSNTGTTAGPVWSFTTGTPATDVVVYASDVPTSAIHGLWTVTGDATSPDGIKLATAATGWSTAAAPLASPNDYVDVAFTANAGTPYTLWMRLRATNNSKASDSVWVQFSDASAGGSPVFPIGSTSGLLVKLASDSSASSDNAWGWVDGAYWFTQPTTFTFPTTGIHTMRIQVRYAGVQFDQIVLSPSTYFNPSASCPNACAGAPGPITNDHTIVPKPSAGSAPAVPGSPSPASGATAVSTTPTLTWAAAGATSYDVKLGTTNPPALAAAGMTSASYTPDPLGNSTTYFWQVVAHNGSGSTSGPVWSFTTVAAAPAMPASPSPANGATGVTTTPTLTWTSSGATSYDVSFGTTNPPAQTTTGQAAASYTPSALAAGTTYFWQIVAHNAGGATTGPVWSFATVPAAQPPAAPASPAPANGATGVSTTPTLTWSAAGATSYDISFGTANPPPLVTSGATSASYAPPTLAAGTTYFWQIVARNDAGTASGPVWSFTTAAPPTDIVVYASDVTPGNIHGMWTVASDATSPNGLKLATPFTGWSSTGQPLAAPADYVDVPFTAPAGVPFTLWIRVEALNNAKASDSLWVQFSDAQVNGTAAYPINTTSGLLVNLATDTTAASDQAWGWVNGAYWLAQSATVTFAAGGTHTLRVQVRESGVMFDQIVLSPATYLNPSASCPNTCGAAPGTLSNDHTIVPKP